MVDLISREALLYKIEPDEYYHSNEIRDMLRDCPTVDAASVVRCKDCKNYMDVYGTVEMVCMRIIAQEDYPDQADMFPLEVKMPCLGFCSYGERRNDDAAD